MTARTHEGESCHNPAHLHDHAKTGAHACLKSAQCEDCELQQLVALTVLADPHTARQSSKQSLHQQLRSRPRQSSLLATVLHAVHDGHVAHAGDALSLLMKIPCVACLGLVPHDQTAVSQLRSILCPACLIQMTNA